MKDLLKKIQSLKIPYEYTQEKDGTYSVWTQPNNEKVISTWGQGKTLWHACGDLISGLREIAYSYFEDADIPEELVPCVLKILIYPDEGIRKCLIGKICEDI